MSMRAVFCIPIEDAIIARKCNLKLTIIFFYFFGTRQHSQGEILNNFEHYERIFKESTTVPPSLNVANGGDNNMTYSAIAEAATEPRVENPHFCSPETFHNAMSFRSYDNHGFGKSISSLLDTFSGNDSIKQDYSMDRDYDMGSSGSRGSLSLRTSNKFDSFFNSKDSSTSSKSFSDRRPEFLRNTPADFPMIIREAMADDRENRIKGGRHAKFSQARRQIPRQNAVWCVVEGDSNGGSNQALPAPVSDDSASEPDTPLIENAPQSIDFISAVNSAKNATKSKSPNDDESSAEATDTINANDNDMVLETPSSDINLNLENVFNKNKANFNAKEIIKENSNFHNKIDAIQLDDILQKMYTDLEISDLNKSMENLRVKDDQLPPPHCNDINSNVGAKPKPDHEEDDDVFREYNSHQYWYISPDMPVDTDILLDPEEKSMY